MPMFKVAIMVVWLSNADGSILAHASGMQLTCRLVSGWPPRRSLKSPATRILTTRHRSSRAGTRARGFIPASRSRCVDP